MTLTFVRQISNFLQKQNNRDFVFIKYPYFSLDRILSVPNKLIHQKLPSVAFKSAERV
ncbi:hypothetical protein C8R34_1291 [Nitrosomonas sp. Nm84]|nr:hypothetical protein C8R34_1291 [Nitrosomonas sp. Nm84]